MSLPPDLQKVLTWPIHTKGAIKRHNPLGDPKIEKNYHQALEDGRWLEQNIGDANHWLLQKKQYVTDKIKTYTDMNSLAVDAQLKRRPRVFKLGADSIRLLQTVNQFQQDIIGLIQAITQNIGLLSSMEQNIIQMVQANLNALAILMNNICNWGLPDLPAIPNLFSDTVWNWNGFNFFPLAAFKPQLGFDYNFAFNLCQLHVPNINIFRNYPSTVNTYSGLQYGTPLFVPPLGGIIPNTGQNLSDPNFIATMQVTNTDPVYGPKFNPNSSMQGAVPDAATIISNYQMPAQVYHDNIVSIVPSLRGNTVEPGDPDYQNPDVQPGSLRADNLRRDLVHYITLDEVVSSNYDPFITSAWLYYLDNARGGRSGSWLPQYESVYQSFVQPSVTSLTSSTVPWNACLGTPGIEYRSIWDATIQYQPNDVVVFNGLQYMALVENVDVQPDQGLTTDPPTWQYGVPAGTVFQNTPSNIPLVSSLQSMDVADRTLLLWKLSFVEASLLGYTRSKTWDAYQDTNYVSGVTGSDLDYVPTVIDLSKTTTVTLGQGTATYPPVMTYPVSFAATLAEVITKATADIAADLTYQSPRLSSRFVYNQFAQATQVDRFTQFWRDFNTNMIGFLAQDPYLIQFAVTYVDILNGALNPLGDPTAYNALKVDVATRTRTWVPGNPLLTIPVAPIVSYQSDNMGTSSGWQGITFDANAFLARPDIQAQPISVQIAMLRTNVSYAGLLQYAQQATNAIDQQIATAKAILAQASQLGFKVESTVDQTVTVGSNYTVAFDMTDFDVTGNVTNPTTFTIQSAGEYAVFGALNWETPAQTGETYSVTVLKNAVAILSQSSDPSFTTPYGLQFSATDNFAVGDVVQVIASHTYGTDQTLGTGSFFSMIQSGPTDTTQIPSSATSNTRTFVADTNLASLTAVAVQADGGVAGIDPTKIVGSLNAPITNVQIAGNVLTVTCANSFIAGSTIYNFSGLTGATFLNGQSITVMTASPTQFTAAYVHADYASAPDTGIANGGPIIFPIVDGVTTMSATTGGNVEVANNYGGAFQITPSPAFTTGGLLYVSSDGTLTQDYNAIISGGSPVLWIICVGRAISADTFIYEPHIPTRVVGVM